MMYRVRSPGPPLSRFVDLLWFSEGAPKPHMKERLLPDGAVELVVNLVENRIQVYGREDHNRFDTHRGSIVSGPHSQFFVIDTSSQDRVAGVHFRPGGAYPFLGVPATEARNVQVSLEDLWGADAELLREQLLEAADPDAMFDVFEGALLARAGGRLERHAAVNFALQRFQRAPESTSVGSVTGQIGLSAKRFIELFSAEVGLTPKVFCRVRRFQGVIQSIQAGRKIDWAGVALSSGYFDQAHFNHDFRAFSGLSPSEYLTRRTAHVNHVSLV